MGSDQKQSDVPGVGCEHKPKQECSRVMLGSRRLIHLIVDCYFTDVIQQTAMAHVWFEQWIIMPNDERGSAPERIAVQLSM